MIDLDIVLKEYNIPSVGVIHVGGHQGQEYEDYKKAGLHNQIWIEAIDSYFQDIQQKIQNDENCFAFNEVIYDVEKEINFGVANNGASSSILPLKLHKKYYPYIEYNNYITLFSKRLDTLIRNNNLDITKYNGLVMDVQGAELNVAKSLGNLISKFDFIQSEVNTEELYEGCCLIEELDRYLAGYNFIRVVTKMWDDGAVGWGDALYIKKSINILIPYWDMGCEIRKQNTTICWQETKKMVSYLKSKDLNISCHLFEFGKTNNFEDSIKIDIELDYYELSKKRNICINHSVNNTANYIAFIDSDCFFSPSQYDVIYNDIINLFKLENYYYTYNLIDIDENQKSNIVVNNTIDYNLLEKEYSNFKWRHPTGIGTLGGFFISPLKQLKEIGGFNENFLTWGAEDDEAHVRLKSLLNWEPKIYGPYHLYHPKNLNNTKYYIPVYTKEYFDINKVNKPT